MRLGWVDACWGAASAKDAVANRSDANAANADAVEALFMSSPPIVRENIMSRDIMS